MTNQEKKWTVGILLLLLPLFEPGAAAGVSWLEWLDPIYAIGKVVTILVLVVLVIREGKFDLYLLAIIAFVFAILLSEYANDYGVANWIKACSPYVAVSFLVSISCKKGRSLLWAILTLTTVLSLLNLLSMFVYPEGMYNSGGNATNDSFFWRNRNSAYQLILPAITTSFLLDHVQDRYCSMRTAFIIVISILQQILSYSATTTTAMLVLLAGILVLRSVRTRRVLNAYTYFFGYITLFYSIVILRLQEMFSAVFEGFFGRSSTLTGRTNVWDWVFFHMNESHALLGYGLSNQVLRQYAISYVSAHNMVLHIWFIGGILSLIPFIILMLSAARALFIHRREWIAAVLALTVGSFLIIGLSEAMLCSSFFLILALARYSQSLLIDQAESTHEHYPTGEHQ